MKYILLCISLSLFAVSCAHKNVKPPESALAYPYGTYQHRVKVQIIEPARTMDVRGIVQSQNEELKVVGLSNFGTTVFRVEENLKTGEINKEFYVEALRKNEEKFMSFYELIKELLRAPKGPTTFEKRGAKFTLTNPDENQIYRTVAIEHPQVKIGIDVTSYEF